MFETIFNDLTGSVEAVIDTNTWMVLGIIAIIALAQGLTMGSWTNGFGRAGQGLLVLALVLFLWDVLDNENRFEWTNWNNEGQESWLELMAMTLRTLLGYYVVMWLGIMVVYVVKSLVNR